jgi:hypothetical protein
VPPAAARGARACCHGGGPWTVPTPNQRGCGTASGWPPSLGRHSAELGAEVAGARPADHHSDLCRCRRRGGAEHRRPNVVNLPTVNGYPRVGPAVSPVSVLTVGTGRGCRASRRGQVFRNDHDRVAEVRFRLCQSRQYQPANRGRWIFRRNRLPVHRHRWQRLSCIRGDQRLRFWLPR